MKKINTQNYIKLSDKELFIIKDALKLYFNKVDDSDRMFYNFSNSDNIETLEEYKQFIFNLLERL
jgi:hypothetical protein